MCIQRARSGPKAELVTTTQPSSSRPQEHSAVALRLPPSLEEHASLIDIASPTRAGWEMRLGDHFRDHPAAAVLLLGFARRLKLPYPVLLASPVQTLRSRRWMWGCPSIRM